MAFRPQKPQFFICFKVNPQKKIKYKNKVEKKIKICGKQKITRKGGKNNGLL